MSDIIKQYEEVQKKLSSINRFASFNQQVTEIFKKVCIEQQFDLNISNAYILKSGKKMGIYFQGITLIFEIFIKNKEYKVTYDQTERENFDFENLIKLKDDIINIEKLVNFIDFDFLYDVYKQQQTFEKDIKNLIKEEKRLKLLVVKEKNKNNEHILKHAIPFVDKKEFSKKFEEFYQDKEQARTNIVYIEMEENEVIIQEKSISFRNDGRKCFNLGGYSTAITEVKRLFLNQFYFEGKLVSSLEDLKIFNEFKERYGNRCRMSMEKFLEVLAPYSMGKKLDCF